MFSKRTPTDFSENALAQRTRQRRLNGEVLLDLTESNPTRVGLLAPADMLLQLANSASARYSPEPRGLRAAREAVSRDYARRGAVVDPDHIILTASSSESYSMLFKLLADTGDDVLVPTPSYPLFQYLAELDSLRAVAYPLDFDHEWHVSLDTVRSLTGARTRAIVAVHPNNPTGSFLKKDEAQALTDLCVKRRIAIVADEVFADFAFGTDDPRRYSTFAQDSPALRFALGGLSKSCGLPQLKLGWIAVSGPAPLRDEAVARLEFIADTYLSVGTPVQLALAGILDRKDELQAPIRSRLNRNLQALGSAVASHPELSLLPVEGGWSALIQCPATKSDEDRALLAVDQGVLVHPGHFFDLESSCCLVVSLLSEPAVLDEALPVLMSAAVG